MKWIQASEKLPPIKVDVVIKEYSGTVDIGWYSDTDGKIHTESDLGPLSINQVEWLDEFPSEQSSTVGVEELAKVYANQKQIDRWVYTMEQRLKFCIEDFKAGYAASEGEEAIGFAEWIISIGYYKNLTSGKWYDPNERYPKYFSMNELYNIYKQSKI